MKPFLLAAVALLACAARLTAAAPQSLDDCTAQFLAHPLALDAASCFPDVAEHLRQTRQTLARIERLLANGRADDPVLRLSRARVLAFLPDADLAESEREHDLRTAITGFAQRLDARGELTAHANLWRLLIRQGRLAEARTEVSRALATVRRNSPTALPSGLLGARALLLEAKQLLEEGGDLALAERRLLAIRPYLSLAGQEPYQADLLLALANVWRELGARQDALATYVELEHLASRQDLARYESLAVYGQASVKLEKLAEFEDAETRTEIVRLARLVLDRAHASGDPMAEAFARWILAKLSDRRDAEELLAGCLALPPRDAHRLCLAARAQLLADERPAEAAAALTAARDERKVDPFLAPLIWADLAAASWKIRPPTQAVAESRRALDAIEKLRSSQARGSEKQAEMFSTWTDIFYQFAGHLFASGDLAQAFEVLERLRARALLDAVYGTDPPPTDSAPARFATLEAVRRHLAPDQALLSFQVAPDRDWAGRSGGGSWLLAVSHQAPPRLYRLPDFATLRTEISGWEGALLRHSPEEPNAAARLYAQLLARAITSLPRGVRRLVVVPDDHLHRLPWAALRSSPATGPLVDRFEISVVPSATLWLPRWPRLPRRAAALILADPPLPANLPALPDAEKEGRAVRRAVGGDSLLLTGTRAAEAFLSRTTLPRYAVVHLAAHARVDERNPKGSVIFLAAGRHQDGRLTAAEISALPWDGMLAYLSACESQRGRLLRGEGTMSLARAFFAGRARTVVANLWPVHDDEAFDLARRYYRHLGGGETAAAALRAAQREAARAGLPTAAWAGLTVLGDGDLTLAPPAGASSTLALALVALAVAAGLWAGWRARSRS